MEVTNLQAQFQAVSAVLMAVGDSTRQGIIFTMLGLPCKTEGGARVGLITEKTHLSRPAVSHHLKILKEAGIVGMRREGTKNYYYLEPDQENLLQVRELIDRFIQESRQHERKENHHD